MEANALKKAMQNFQVILVENTRFFAEEKNMEEAFCQKISDVFDYFVNDSFGNAHRKEASNYAIARYFKTSSCGLLVKKELENLTFLLKNPPSTFVAILGGAKVKDKITAVQNLVERVDYLFIGGGMAYTFLKARGEEIGKSILDEEYLKTAEQILKKYDKKILLPEDNVVAEKIGAPTFLTKKIPKGKIGVDIGENTISRWINIISKAKTIFWNGPLGVFELEACAKGTFSIAKAVAFSKARQVIGGGDSILAINRLNLKDKIQHISTGGGASIDFISGKALPGIEILTNLK